jgi:hypothetical protein
MIQVSVVIKDGVERIARIRTAKARNGDEAG